MHNFCFFSSNQLQTFTKPALSKVLLTDFLFKNILKNVFKEEFSTLTNDLSKNNLTCHMNLLLLNVYKLSTGMPTFRSGHWSCSMKTAFFKILVILRKNQHSCFPVYFAKFLKTPFWQNTFGRLLLNLEVSKRVFFCKISNFEFV